MTPVTTLLRWSGAAAMLGAVGIAQAPILHPHDTHEGLVSPIWVPTHFAMYLGYILVQFGLMGVLARQFQAAQKLGVVGFALAFVGVSLTLMEGRDHIFSVPVLRLAGLQSSNPDALPGLWLLILSAAVFSVGHILLGIATFRARVLPPTAAVVMAVGAPILAFAPPIGAEAALIGSALYAAAWLWLGFALLGTREAASGLAARASRTVQLAPN
jgi:hypothetical protein